MRLNPVEHGRELPLSDAVADCPVLSQTATPASITPLPATAIEQRRRVPGLPLRPRLAGGKRPEPAPFRVKAASVIDRPVSALEVMSRPCVDAALSAPS
jgi:hypothetical protein